MASCVGIQGDGADNQDSDQQLVKIDSDGDLILVVGSTKTRFLVCSKTLSRSAPFWKRCLYGPFREAKPDIGQDWEVEFPEDNPSAMKYVLLLAHALGHKLPKITLQLAFEVTVLTNKYNMTQLLWAVSRSWLEVLPGAELAVDDTIVSELQWLWVTKELGAMDEYSKSFAALSQIVATTAEDDDILSLGRPYRHDTIYLGQPSRPDYGDVLTKECLKGYDAEKDVILLFADEIKSARETALEKIQGNMKKDMFMLKNAVKWFDSSKGCEGARICTGRTSDGYRSPCHPNKKRRCEYTMQAIVTKISARKDSAVKPAAKVGRSVESYLASATRFVDRIEKEIVLIAGRGHENCTPFESGLPSRKELMDMTLLNWRRQNQRAFEKQARISGLAQGGDNEGNREDALRQPSVRKRSHDESNCPVLIDLSSDFSG